MLYVQWVMPLYFCLRSDARLSLTKSIQRELYNLLPQKSFCKLAKVCLGKDLKDQRQQGPYFQLLLCGRIHCQLSFFDAPPLPLGDGENRWGGAVKGFQMPGTLASIQLRQSCQRNPPADECYTSRLFSVEKFNFQLQVI